MESMINRIYSMSDADTKPFFPATSVGAKDNFINKLSQLWNNKAITAFAALLCFLCTAHTHAQTLEWVKTFGGKGSDIGTSIAVDNEGNIYTTGTFQDTVDFDPGIDLMKLFPKGYRDVFIQKLDAQGNFLWAKSFGGKGNNGVTSIAIDTKGNIYLTGGFQDTVDFDPGIGVVNLSSVGQEDIFIQKLDANGNFLWAKSFGGMSGDRARSVVIDSKGNVYTTGYFQRMVDFDPGTGVTNLFAVGQEDIFIQKLDAQGNFLWAKSFGGDSVDKGHSIAIDVKGNVYTTGYFQRMVDFDPGTDSMKLSSVRWIDIFMQKLDENGNFLWAKSFEGSYNNYIPMDISVDDEGNIFATGKLVDTVDFDPGIGVMKLSAVGDFDTFVLKLDANGNFLWAKSFGGDYTISGFSIAIDAANNVYTTGIFQGTVDFDPGIDVMKISAKGSDIFVQKLDKNGNFLWAKSFGGKNYNHGYSIAIDDAGNVYTTGFFEGTVDFDPASDVKNLSSVGNFDIFIHKMKQTATGVADMGNGIDISLYPNPSNGFIHISLKDNAGDATITITDLQGKLIHSEEMSAATTSSIDIQAPDGVYFVNVKTAKGQTISKFIKEQSSLIFPNR